MNNVAPRLWSARVLLVGLLLSSHALLAQTNLDSRVALIIGNSAYDEAPLRNPVNDARAMSHALKLLGFRVTSLENASREAMEQAIVEFTSRLQSDTAGLFYYAGHGVQLRGRNYLVPVDANIGSERQVRVESVDVNLLLEEMEYARNRVNVVILDACRNNPFERRLRGTSRGLAAIDAARGTLIAYATAPGSVAMDGDGMNGLYTEELLDALMVPGLSVEKVFKRVRGGVAKRTNDRQIPWESSSLVGEFVLNQSPSLSGAAPAGQTTSAPTPGMVEQKDLLFWESVKESQDVAAYRVYLEQFPNGTFAALARLRIKQLENRSRQQAGAGSQSSGSEMVAALTPESSASAPATIRRRDRLSGAAYKVAIVWPVTSIPQRQAEIPVTDIRKALHGLVCRREELVRYHSRDSLATGQGRIPIDDCGGMVGDVHSRDDLWRGNMARWVPAEKNVYALGRELGVDVVLMSFYKRTTSGSYSYDRYAWEGYLYDIGLQRAYHVKGDQDSVARDSERLLAEFLDNRGVSTATGLAR